jgi:peptidoglycan/xylan/chitin deacetylase (PgdA/CDA1 family)
VTVLGVPLALRARLGRALDRLGLLDRLFWLRARLGLGDLAVMTYHRVGRPGDVGELDPGLVEVEPAELEAQLAVIRTHCTIVSLSDVRRIDRGKRLPPNPVLITFDDGYRDNHDVALPILRRAGVPATFFIPTAFPDAGKLFWWDRVWLFMRRCRLDRVDLDYPQPLVLQPASAPEEAARLVCQAIKRTPGVDHGRLWEALEQRTLVSLGRDEERALAARTIMGWSRVQALRDAGMDVQSHSHEHLVLNTLTPDAARQDLLRSSQTLREALGQDIYGVAYPVGYAVGGALRWAPANARFELGFTNCTGLCRVGDFDPLNVPRISMSLETLGAAYKMQLLFGDRAQAPVTMLPPVAPVASAGPPRA